MIATYTSAPATTSRHTRPPAQTRQHPPTTPPPPPATRPADTPAHPPKTSTAPVTESRSVRAHAHSPRASHRHKSGTHPPTHRPASTSVLAGRRPFQGRIPFSAL